MSKSKILIFTFLIFISILGVLNSKYELVAIHPFKGEDSFELRVLTWNVHRTGIVDANQQLEMAKVIVAQNADYVQLNEFTLDSCLVLDSLLRRSYQYVEDVNANLLSGDIIYSKKELYNSGQKKFFEKGKSVPNVAANIVYGRDSVSIVGVHLTGNNDSITKRIVKSGRRDFFRHSYLLYKQRGEDRKFCAHYLKQWAIECPHPMIIMGDMNDFSFSAPLDSLKDAGMKNAWWEGGFGYGATFKQGWMKLRIDHVYYNDQLELKDVKVINSNLSDHNILVADFLLFHQ